MSTIWLIQDRKKTKTKFKSKSKIKESQVQDYQDDQDKENTANEEQQEKDTPITGEITTRRGRVSKPPTRLNIHQINARNNFPTKNSPNPEVFYDGGTAINFAKNN